MPRRQRRDGASAGTWRRLAWWLNTPEGLACLFGSGLAVRLLVAPHIGFFSDLDLFRQWADRLPTTGLRHFYAKGYFADYPPGYLFVLYGIGKIASAPSYILLKLPAILGDLAVAGIAATFAERLTSPAYRERVPVRAIVAAAFLFNPAVLALSSVWGQVDVVPAAFVLGSLLLALTGRISFRRDLVAIALFAVAVAMKPQSGFMFPALLYLLVRRYLLVHEPAARRIGVARFAALGGVAFVVWAASGIPFGLGPIELVRFYSHSSSLRPVTSVWAFNLWGAFGFWRNDASGDAVTAIFGIPAFYAGVALYLSGVALILRRAHVAIERGQTEAHTVLVAAAACSLVAFAVLTRMHERYLFPALVCAAPLVLWRNWRRAYVVISALFLVNLWFPFGYYNLQSRVTDLRVQPFFDAAFGGLSTDSVEKKFWSVVLCVACLFVVARGFHWIAGENTATVAPLSLPRWRPERLAASAVGLVCAFNLFVLRGETSAAPNLNDSALHLPMVQWASRQISNGRVPLDGWFPNFSLGSSQFHHYQSLPHTLTAYVSHAFGSHDQTTYLWLQYLLLALWPVAVYAGARLMGWARWPAAAAAVLAPFIVSAPGYGYEHGSYTWRGYGVYSQLWGMWALPLAWGFTWRAVSRGKGWAAAALALALTIATHFLTGYLAVLTVGVWALLAWHGIGRRIARAVAIVAASVLTAAWVLVPLLSDRSWSAQSAFYKGTLFNDSYGARRILGWLFTGKLFDAGRLPVISVLVATGVVVCILRCREDERARALFAAFGFSLLLFFGRPTLGPLIGLLPGNDDLQIHRFIMGVHLAGLLLAGVGLTVVCTRVAQFVRGAWPAPAVAAAAAAAVAFVGLAPAWTDIASFDARGRDLINGQRLQERGDGADLARLIRVVRTRADGRVYAGLRSNWGADYKVGSVPVFAELADEEIDAIGFTFRTVTALSTDVEASFDETNIAQYQALGVRYVLLPPDRSPTVAATLLRTAGRHRLFEIVNSGYVQVVDRVGSVTANRSNLASASREFMASAGASRSVYPGVAFDGAPSPAPTVPGVVPVSTPGVVLRQSARDASDGVFTANVLAYRPAVALLKASFDPRWTATVDGVRVTPVMMAPSLVGVDVGAGTHEVLFRYRPYPRYPPLLGLGAVTLAALALIPRRERVLELLRKRVG